jgi:hypothetical protein
MLKYKLEGEDFYHWDLFQKKIYSRLEPDKFYRGDVIVVTRWNKSQFLYVKFIQYLIEEHCFFSLKWFFSFKERWSFPYKNDIQESSFYLRNLHFIITSVTNRYPDDERFDIFLEFTKLG